MNESDSNEYTLARLVTQGGIYYNVPGNTRQEILTNIIDKLQDWEPQKKESLLQVVLEREAIISTGMEKGIALPHPRTPMLAPDEEPFVAIAFPDNTPADWLTPDNSKVHTIFLIVSKSPKQHLSVMSGIGFLCQHEQFYKLISARVPKEKIIAAIEELESEW